MQIIRTGCENRSDKRGTLNAPIHGLRPDLRFQIATASGHDTVQVKNEKSLLLLGCDEHHPAGYEKFRIERQSKT